MSTMTISSIIATEKQSSNTSKAPTSTVFISSNVCAPSLNSGATVFVHDSTTIHDGGIPDVQSANNEHKSDFGEESSHVLKINITPATNLDKVMSSECYNQDNQKSEDSCIRISVVTNPGPDPIKDGRKNVIIRQKDYSPISTSIRSCFYYQNPLIASGQCSPSETLDSGTCSDLDSASLPLPMKKNASTVVLGNSQHTRTGSLTSSGAEVDSDDNESNVSCDSLNNADLSKSDNEINDNDDCKLIGNGETVGEISATFKDIHLNKIAELASNVNREDAKRRTDIEQVTTIVNECSYEERKREKLERKSSPGERATEFNGSGRYTYENDRFYKFHLNECRNDPESSQEDEKFAEEECFAGVKILEREAIRSAKGTVRGVKNRVRAGIATFLQKPSTKDFKLKDAGKVVVYTTTMGIVRETYYACMKVKQILRTHLIKYEERDLYMSVEYQAELKDRINSTVIDVPQLFIDGQLIGDVNTVDRLNESGDLRLMLKPYQSSMVYNTCTHCGGFRLYPCPVCNGSKKSVHRNDFTAEFVALKCMNCDEVGLVRCNNC